MRIAFPDGSVYDKRAIAPGPQGDYVEMKHKWLVDKGVNVFVADNINLKTKGVPSVSQMVQPPTGYHEVVVTKALSDWWWMIQEELFPAAAAKEEIGKCLTNITIWKKAFNNKRGHSMPPDVGTPRNNYFSGDRKGQGYPEDMGLLWCWAEGSIYKKVGERRLQGETCVAIEAIDARKPSTWPTSYAGYEHLFTIATNAYRDTLAPHGYRLDPFPPFPVDNVQRHAIVPLFVNNENVLYIQKKYTQPVPSFKFAGYGRR